MTAATKIKTEDKQLIPLTLNDISDAGNAEFFAIQNKGRFLYNHHNSSSSGWYIQDGKRYRQDETDEIFQYAINTIKQLPACCIATDDTIFKKMLKHVVDSLAINRIRAMLALAKSRPEFAVISADLDRDPLLFNVENGTINLRTGTLQPHNKADRITKLASVKYDPEAQCPKWLTFIEEIFGGDLELIGYLQRVLGLCLSGLTDHQCFWFFFGTGCNGKSAFIKVLENLIGDYFMRGPADMLMCIDNRQTNDIARLVGCRVLVCSEVAEGSRFSEQRLKDLTGGDSIAARFLHQEFFQFTPVCKLIIAGNHRPGARGSDYGFWRRVREVPFLVTIPEDKQRPFEELVADLCSELSGILNWALRGWMLYRSEGWGTCQAIDSATAEYKKDSDRIGKFIEERLVEFGGCTPGKEIYGDYRQWAKENGEYELSRKAFDERLKQHGFNSHRGTGGAYVWEKISIRVFD
jgi:putative DNA primase/helicase